MDPRTNVYGAARSLIAAASAATLLTTPFQQLFAPRYASVIVQPQFGLTGTFHNHPIASKWLLIAVLLLVVSGFRPRWTAVPHWLASTAIQLDGTLIDGGDQVAAVLSLLILPIALSDGRKWHWTFAAHATPSTNCEFVQRYLLSTSAVLIRLQVCGIYLDAATGKMAHQEWADGTAMYYWMGDDVFGAAGWSRWFVEPLMRVPICVCAITWAVILVELFLASAMVLEVGRRRIALVFGIALHLAIFLLQGLASFAVTMCAALTLYLIPLNSWLNFNFFRLNYLPAKET